MDFEEFAFAVDEEAGDEGEDARNALVVEREVR